LLFILLVEKVSYAFIKFQWSVVFKNNKTSKHFFLNVFNLLTANSTVIFCCLK